MNPFKLLIVATGFPRFEVGSTHGVDTEMDSEGDTEIQCGLGLLSYTTVLHSHLIRTSAGAGLQISQQ